VGSKAQLDNGFQKKTLFCCHFFRRHFQQMSLRI
jgi:hypothetical protein